MDKNDDKRRYLLVEMTAGFRPAPSGGHHDALLHPWRCLARHLSPLIGESGFCALYSRSGRLVQPLHGWLGAGATYKTIDGAIADLAARFGDAGAEQAGEANLALLETFTGLLAGLIGEALTNRLLQAAVQDQGEQKNAQEQK
jgi:hypothetical protein